jgi:hypothetical protein
MEQILRLYERAYNPEEPVVCLDETTKQLTGEVRVPLPSAPGRPERYDSQYRRNGVATIFLFLEPLRGWRRINVTEGKTRGDFAEQLRELLEVHYPRAKKVHVVQDNLSTHAGSTLYERMSPEAACRLLDRVDFHYTPKHGSWLNMAEIEFSALSRRCLRERMSDASTLIQEIRAWESDRNHRTIKVDWQFTASDARIKLKRLYPIF